MIKLKQVRMNDLYAVMNSMTPKELVDLKTIRKLSGAVEALEKTCRPYFDKVEKIQKEADKLIAPYREKLQVLQGKEDDKSVKERSKMEKEANKVLEPTNKKLVALIESEGEAVVVCEIDGNYLDELKNQFKKHAAEKFNSMKAYVEIADALGIEE